MRRTIDHPSRTTGPSEELAGLVAAGRDALEPLRSRALGHCVRMWVTAACALSWSWAVFVYVPESARAWVAVASASVVGAILILLGGRAADAATKMRAEFDAWRLRVVAAIEPDAVVRFDGFLPREDFDDSGIFDDLACNSYGGDCAIELGAVRTSNVDADYVYEETVTVSYTDQNGNAQSRQEKRTRVIPVFHGLFLVGRAKLPHRGWVLLTAPGSLPRGLSHVRVPSRAVDHAWAVGADDKFVGHRVLTPAFVEELVAFRGRLEAAPLISFRHGAKYVAAPGARLDLGAYPSRLRRLTSDDLADVCLRCRATIERVKWMARSLRPS